MVALLTVGIVSAFAQARPPNSHVIDSRQAVNIDTALWTDLRFWAGK